MEDNTQNLKEPIPEYIVWKNLCYELVNEMENAEWVSPLLLKAIALLYPGGRYSDENIAV